MLLYQLQNIFCDNWECNNAPQGIVEMLLLHHKTQEFVWGLSISRGRVDRQHRGLSWPFAVMRRWENIWDRVRKFSHKAKGAQKGDSCNRYLLLKCRKGLVSHSEIILTPPKNKWPTSCQVSKGFQCHLWFHWLLCPAMCKEKRRAAPHLHVYVGRPSQVNNYHKQVLRSRLAANVTISTSTLLAEL